MIYTLDDVLHLLQKHTYATAVDQIIIGQLLPFISQNSRSSGQSLSWHMDRLSKFRQANKICVFYDDCGQFCGFLIYAKVSLEIGEKILSNGFDCLEDSELSSGNEIWIFDFFVSFGELMFVLANLQHTHFKDASSITYFRYKFGRKILKTVEKNGIEFFSKNYFTKSKIISQKFLETKKAESFLNATINSLNAAQELGEVAQFLKNIPILSKLQLPTFIKRICRPARLMQQRIYRNSNGKICGYLTWCLLSNERLEKGVPPSHQLESFELNAGVNFVLCDAYATIDGIGYIRDFLENEVLSNSVILVRAEYLNEYPISVKRLVMKNFDLFLNFDIELNSAIDLLEKFEILNKV